jgi:predicted transcriptional regulator
MRRQLMMLTIDVDADQIWAARQMLRWSQGELAERPGVSRVTLANIEAGKIAPQIRTLRRIIDALEGAGIAFDAGGVRKAT